MAVVEMLLLQMQTIFAVSIACAIDCIPAKIQFVRHSYSIDCIQQWEKILTQTGRGR